MSEKLKKLKKAYILKNSLESEIFYNCFPNFSSTIQSTIKDKVTIYENC